jgi:CDP-glycerol glycerophosphotransferase (TagB/SpsB family)
MIRAAAGAVQGRCYVKPHPLMTDEQRTWLGKLCDRLPNATIVDASVHDIIRASAVIVSQNSAVGFEALMHRKPVITCARTDYAAASLVCTTTAELHDNIGRATSHFADFPFEKYFYWFLGLNMQQPQNEDFAARAMAILYGE